MEWSQKRRGPVTYVARGLFPGGPSVAANGPMGLPTHKSSRYPCSQCGRRAVRMQHAKTVNMRSVAQQLSSIRKLTPELVMLK
jgi:hypothetical protein